MRFTFYFSLTIKYFEKYGEGTGSMDILQIDKSSDRKKQNKMWMGGKHKAYEQKEQ